MADFLLELLSEEIPARMQAKARADLERLFVAEIGEAGLKAEDITVYSTPRRLPLIARGLPEKTEAVREERKGPKADAPDQAIEGFKRQLPDVTQYETRTDAKGNEVLFGIIDKPGIPTEGVLMNAIHSILRTFPWPKSMRWGSNSSTMGSLKWIRPLQGIVAIFDDRPIICDYEGIQSGAETVGHRFHHDGPITIGGVDDYREKLRACHVIVDHKEREGIIRERANALADEAGLTRKQDPGLVEENAGLTEWPVPLLGSFDEAFLAVAPEAITLAMRSHQKYFACLKADGSLSPHFICVANIEAADGGAHVVAGNEKVLAARLSDARFFWEQDQKVSLADHAKKLDQIVFHEALGTVAQRIERITTVASDWLPEMVGWPESKAREMQPLLKQAAELAKADLVTGMVGEFPELQGIMGSYYARSLGSEVSEAIRDQYKPTGPKDELPSGDVGRLLALADKADALFGFFAYGMKPTGSKDPFALRRAALGIIRIVIENDLRLSLRRLFNAVEWERLYESDGVGYSDPSDELVQFVVDRLKVQQREAGVRHDLIDAVFALGGEDDLVRLLARVKALQAFLKTADGANLLAGYKRAANILKKEKWEPVEGDYNPEPTEALLREALRQARPRAAAAIEGEDFEGAMAALATLRKPIDAFFENVTVNDDDPVKRAARLAMLESVRDAVHRVADFSKIEG